MSAKVLRLLMLTVLAALVAVPIAGAAISASSSNTADKGNQSAKNDNRLTKLDVKKNALLQTALQKKLNGKAYGKVGEVARGQYVQLELEGEGAVWTMLGEFADLSHNTIPEPDRTVDNSTY